MNPLTICAVVLANAAVASAIPRISSVVQISGYGQWCEAGSFYRPTCEQALTAKCGGKNQLKGKGASCIECAAKNAQAIFDSCQGIADDGGIREINLFCKPENFLTKAEMWDKAKDYGFTLPSYDKGERRLSERASAGARVAGSTQLSEAFGGKAGCDDKSGSGCEKDTTAGKCVKCADSALAAGGNAPSGSVGFGACSGCLRDGSRFCDSSTTWNSVTCMCEGDKSSCAR